MGKRAVHINSQPLSKNDYGEILAARNPSSAIFMIFIFLIFFYIMIFFMHGVVCLRDLIG